MGGRGSAGERGSSNGSISSLQKQIEVLGNQMQTLAKYAVHDGRNYNEKKLDNITKSKNSIIRRNKITIENWMKKWRLSEHHNNLQRLVKPS